ncbi:MAG TPA: hypothetical protein VFT22_24635, partial [Kofleriaceae bacterium]|nr:hypothetical protein [Kofleriaceae bacterium]
TGELGASCTYSQFCKSLLCQGVSDDQVCTQKCVPDQGDTCPSGFDCVASTATSGLCLVSGAGCCRVDRSGQGWLAHAALGAALLGFLARRRRRR